MDRLNVALDAGLSLDEIQRMQRAGASLEEIIGAANRLIERGEALAEVDGEIAAWEPPIPFDAAELPSFPTESLPAPVEAFVEALAESTQTPAEMGGMLALGVMATCLQRKFEVMVSPDWSEPLNLFVGVIAPPAERKSAVLSAVTKPLRDHERERREIDAPAIARNQSEKKMLEGRLAAAQAAAVKGKMDEREGKRQEALDLAAELAEFEELHELRLLADDATPEKLADLMAQQGGSITLCSAEGGIFDAMTGRYEKALNIDIYLKGHSGDPLVVDRLGRSGNRIENPHLTTLLAFQPEVLADLMGNRAFRGRGLCARFLFATCKGSVGRRKVNPEPVRESVKEGYNRFVRRLMDVNGEGPIQLSTEADRLRQEYQALIERRLVREWDDISDWGGKLVGAVCRIAAILHCGTSDCPTATPIAPETFDAAVRIGEFLGAHAISAFGIMGGSQTVSDAKYILRRIIGMTAVTRSELTRLCQGHFRRAADMGDALRLLEDMNYLRASEELIGYQGRSQTSYEINPAFCVK